MSVPANGKIVRQWWAVQYKKGGRLMAGDRQTDLPGFYVTRKDAADAIKLRYLPGTAVPVRVVATGRWKITKGNA